MVENASLLENAAVCLVTGVLLVNKVNLYRCLISFVRK